jgi:hypothetical protein
MPDIDWVEMESLICARRVTAEQVARVLLNVPDNDPPPTPAALRVIAAIFRAAAYEIEANEEDGCPNN